MHQRNTYPKPFKAQIVQKYIQPGASVASVAIKHGDNTNVVRKWLPPKRQRGLELAHRCTLATRLQDSNEPSGIQSPISGTSEMTFFLNGKIYEGKENSAFSRLLTNPPENTILLTGILTKNLTDSTRT